RGDTMALETFGDLYLDQIRDLYSAEQQIIDALPKMIERATHPQLSAGFSKHLEQTRQHAQRLEAIAERLGEKIGGQKCQGMQGLLKEGKEAVEEEGDANVIDAALIAAAQ